MNILALIEEVGTPVKTPNQISMYFEAMAEAQREEALEFERLNAERKVRLSKRNLDNEPFLGKVPVPKAFAEKLWEILDNEADVALALHLWRSWQGQFKDNVKPVFLDEYYRRNKLIRGKKLLSRASMERLQKADLFIKVLKGSLRSGKADHYEPTEYLRRLFRESLPLDPAEFKKVVLVDGSTREMRPRRAPSDRLRGVPEDIANLVGRMQGVIVDLNAMLKVREQHILEAAEIMAKPYKSLDKEERRLRGRIESNEYNFLGILINGYIQMEGGDAWLRQSWEVTSTGRLSPRYGGFLNLTRGMRAIGLATAGREVYVVDLKAAQPTLLLTMADDRGFNCPELERYVADKKVRQEYADLIGYGCPVEEVKKSVISLCMGVATPHPQFVENKLKKKEGESELKHYSFVQRFLELGGIKAYRKAYEVFGPIIQFTETMKATLREEGLAQAQAVKGGLRLTNAVGMKETFWTTDRKPAGGISEAELERKLMAFHLQGLEQAVIHQILKDNPDTTLYGYEHDGMTTDKPVTWQRGRLTTENQRTGRTATATTTTTTTTTTNTTTSTATTTTNATDTERTKRDNTERRKRDTHLI